MVGRIQEANFNAICGEARDVSQSVAEDLRSKFPTLIAGYEKRDISSSTLSIKVEKKIRMEMIF